MHAPEQADRVILETLKNKLLTLGIPGLFLISFLDSAGVPLPGGADLVVMLLSWQRPAHLFLIAVVAALGSVLGSLVLYHIARTKGDAMMSRFPKDKQDRVKEKFRRNDILALLVAMLGPRRFPPSSSSSSPGWSAWIGGGSWRRYSPDASSVSWERRTLR